MRRSRRIDWSSAHIRVDDDGLKEFLTPVERVFGLHGETSAILVCLELLQYCGYRTWFDPRRFITGCLSCESSRALCLD